jgi:hypothetical protein
MKVNLKTIGYVKTFVKEETDENWGEVFQRL